MSQITVRIFPINKRASFSSKVITINKQDPTIEDLIKQEPQISFGTHKFCRGTEFLKLDSKLQNLETINIIPL